MKRKIISGILLSFLVILLFSVAIFYILTSSYKLDEQKFVDAKNSITYFSKDGEVLDTLSKNVSVEEIKNIPKNTKNAFIAIEDKRLYKHNGIDYKGLLRATVNNLKSMSFKEGGSTITQQLIKNTHLTNEKTIKRKLIEFRLAKKLEKRYSKDKILETYLNTIYFGENTFGISDASKTYFGKEVNNLTLKESAVLAGIVKAPSIYSPFRNYNKCINRANLVLKKMLEEKLISQDEYNLAINENLSLNGVKSEKNSYITACSNIVDSLIDSNKIKGKNIKIYTNFSKKHQDLLEESLNLYNGNYNKSGIIIDNDGNALAMVGKENKRHQLGSIIKPLLVYAPAIEEGLIDEITPILDEKTDFGGYTPSNYNEKYYGYISAKDALAKSSNVCAVKVLNYLGIDKLVDYAKKFNIEIEESNKNLSLALGTSSGNVSFFDVVACYNSFANNGIYKEYSLINKITDNNGKTLYLPKENRHKVFSESTAFIISDILEETVNTGTAKNMKLDFPISAKTGTVGNKNGNTDAYAISYTKDYAVGIWLENENYMENSITGGTIPSKISKEIWQNLYKNSRPTNFEKPNMVEKISLDKISYDVDHKIVLADEVAPKRFLIDGYFKTSNLPKEKSNRFSYPICENHILSVNINTISIQLCQTQLYDYKIYREFNNKKTLIYDSKNKENKFNFNDENLEKGIYQYTIIPYYTFNNQEFLGKPYLSNKILITSKNIPLENWWQE